MKHLANPLLKTRWVMVDSLPADVRLVAENELERATNSPGWNPKVIKIRRDLHIVNVCADSRQPDNNRALHSIQVALLRDHPFLKYLENLKHVPRSVKSVYKRDVRLAHYRSGEIWPFWDAMNRAEDAWETYKRNIT